MRAVPRRLARARGVDRLRPGDVVRRRDHRHRLVPSVARRTLRRVRHVRRGRRAVDAAHHRHTDRRASRRRDPTHARRLGGMAARRVGIRVHALLDRWRLRPPRVPPPVGRRLEQRRGAVRRAPRSDRVARGLGVARRAICGRARRVRLESHRRPRDRPRDASAAHGDRRRRSGDMARHRRAPRPPRRFDDARRRSRPGDRDRPRR